MRNDQLYGDIKTVVGAEWVSDDPEIVGVHTRDGNIFPQDVRSVMRPPYLEVLPGTEEELQKVMVICKRSSTPVTIVTTGLNVTGTAVPPMGGVLLDLKRLDQIIEIDEHNATITVQPYVSVARVSCELQKRGMFIPVPGCPSTASIMSNFLFGNGHKVTNRVGRQDESVVGYRMILPDGSFFKLGTGTDFSRPQGFWPHGPGPDLHCLPLWTLGTTGIVTQMTIKCWMRGEALKEMWVAYEDLDDAVKSFGILATKEICNGLNLYGGNKYTSYFTDNREAMERMIRANPEYQLIISLEGTKRRIEYEESVVRKIAAETGGVVISDKFKPYKSFVESHLGMSASMYSEYSMRYWGSRGANWVAADLETSDKMADAHRAYSKAAMDDPEYFNPDMGHGEIWRSLISYPYSGGHSGWTEHGIDIHPGDPLQQDMMKRISASYPMYGGQHGLILPPLNRAPREGLPPVRLPMYRLSEQLVKRLDPDNYIHRSMVFV
ncbi:MAG: FAD-binding oxidoreductase [Deltaproteobacteria bacterium]|nr:FAD-binding oxidoreductase [Deltaproteobacteria bacterium]